MRQRIGFVLIITVFLLFNAALITAQEETAESVTAAPEEVTPSSEEIPVSSEPQIQWLWGEVVSVDTVNKTLVVKYMDYESETEKEMNFNVDEKTTYENAQSLDQIKAQDTVSIDYMVDAEGKNIATNISIEKAESQPEEIGSEGTLPPKETTETEY